MKTDRNRAGTPDLKVRVLRESGTLNPRADDVRDPLFLEAGFFDPRDLTQVKYEMLRRVQKDGIAVSTASGSFGFSRPAFYKAQLDFSRQGLVGLIPKRRGPKGGHKLTREVMAFVEELRSREPSLSTLDLVRQIQEEFAVQVHRRTLERALVRAKKKRHAP
jgi:transposase